MRKIAVLVGTGVVAFAMTIAPASAHFCFVKNMNEAAVQGMGGSNGFIPFHDLARQITGLCDDGIMILADAGGVGWSTPIHARTVMAGGSGSNRGIGHLDFAGIDAAFPAAEAACQ
ncbi:hypothetical protein [Nocardioides limicola]|uniref:hypothetical protein n=1 Tax=Nocardioides limicola TaxID=2803368 RepID=UPI00193B8A04|nr:hypothetical protein [Nocardioides sp. DJM-14]